MTSDAAQLSRRERQIMEIVYEHGRATAAEVRDHIADPPSYSAVRAILRILEDKGHKDDRDEGIGSAEEDRSRGLGQHQEFQWYGSQQQPVKGPPSFLKCYGYRQHGGSSKDDGNNNHPRKHD